MRRVCLRCERSAPDSNLLCQELACPAERAPRLLEAGEWLGDIEVVRPLAVLRTFRALSWYTMENGKPVLKEDIHVYLP